MGFPPADDPHSERGRLRKGGAGGKTKAGETAAARLPAAPKETPALPTPAVGGVVGRSGHNGAPKAPQEA